MASTEETPAEAATKEEQKCRKVMLTGFGGYNKLHVQELAIPEPEKGEVRLKVYASGLNFAELMFREGLYPLGIKPPCVPGCECAGVVEKLGEETAGIEIGARVVAFSLKFGGWSEYVCVPVEQCFIMPDEMSFAEGAAIPVNYLTAYFILYDMANIKKGNSVLIHMAAGGVGVAATQLCKLVDDVTIFGTASESKHDSIKEIGVTHPIDYRTKDYVEAIRAISPSGVDVILDPLAGADTKKCFDLLKPLGKLICFGLANSMPSSSKNVLSVAKTWWHGFVFNPVKMMKSNRCVAGFHLLPILDKSKDLVKAAMEELFKLYKEGKIKPRIDSEWALEEVVDGMRKMHERQNVGKVILSPTKKPDLKVKEEEVKEQEAPKAEEEVQVDAKPVDENVEKPKEQTTEEPKEAASTEEKNPADNE